MLQVIEQIAQCSHMAVHIYIYYTCMYSFNVYDICTGVGLAVGGVAVGGYQIGRGVWNTGAYMKKFL
jgi:hypothetical protein